MKSLSKMIVGSAVFAGLLLVAGSASWGQGAASRPVSVATTIPTTAMSDADAEAAILAKLNGMRLGKTSFDGFAFGEVITWLQAQTQVPLRVKWSVLETCSPPITDETTVKCQLPENCTAAQALDILLEAVGGSTTSPTFIYDRGSLLISTKEDLATVRYRTTKIYDVRDLLVSMSGGIGAAAPEPQPTTEPFEPALAPAEPDFDQAARLLTAMITSTVDPTSWRGDAGGDIGSIRSVGTKLIVTQISANHRAIAKLLAEMGEPDWPQMRAKLRQSIPKIDMNAVTLADAVKVMRQHTGLNIVIDPVIAAAKTPPLTLEARDLTGEQVLNHLCRMARVHWALSDGAVCIYPPR